MGFGDSILSTFSARSHFTLDSVVDVACIRRNCYRNHTHIDTEQLHSFIFGSNVRSLSAREFSFEGVGFLAGRLERASEPNGSRANLFV